MLACYYSQGKQLASGVIGLLNCQSHYNVSVINTTPCARLLLRHPLDQRIPTLLKRAVSPATSSCAPRCSGHSTAFGVHREVTQSVDPRVLWGLVHSGK